MRFVKIMAILLCNIFIAAGCEHSFQSPKVQQAATTSLAAKDTDELLKGVKSTDIYGMAVFVNEQPIIEYYKEGYDKNSKFPLYSCTKSIISALVGIAIEQGAIKSTEQYAADFFPALNIQGEAQKIRLQHLLTQTSGLNWPEWSDPKLIPAFVQSKDWVRFVWERPMETAPGSKFNYSTGNSHVLSAIIQQATGQSTLAYAQSNLFGPLGISNFEWQQDPNGVYTGGFGISMTVPDMAKIGSCIYSKATGRAGS
jgi:CubicO group peptidase (beta-lactamase class C family)